MLFKLNKYLEYNVKSDESDVKYNYCWFYLVVLLVLLFELNEYLEYNVKSDESDVKYN